MISNGYVEKFDIEKGDTLTFKQKYKSKEYKFKLTKTYEHPSFFAVFMDIRDFRKTFKEDKDYYNGYFSNRYSFERICKNVIQPYFRCFMIAW